MSTVPLSGVKSRFFSATPLSRFSIKISRFSWRISSWKKCTLDSMRYFQRQVELRRLGNQLPVRGKANSLFKLVKCCVFCIGPGIKISRVIVARAKSMYRTDLYAMYSVAPPGGGKKHTNSRFLRFFVRSVPLFRSLMLTPMYLTTLFRNS